MYPRPIYIGRYVGGLSRAVAKYLCFACVHVRACVHSLTRPFLEQVNPERAADGEDLAANLSNLQNLAQMFFESVLNSIHYFPPYVERSKLLLCTVRVYYKLNTARFCTM
jgi:predicted ATPase